MTAQEKRTLISRIADEIWNQGILSAVDEVMAAEAAYHGPHMPAGKGARSDWKRAIAMYRQAFPDSHVTFEELIGCGETVVGRWRATGTHLGPMPGLEPTGRKIVITGITIYRFSGGKISEAWEQLDLLGMWRQLGVAAVPGH